MSYNFATFTQKADHTLQHLLEDIGTLRTGRATIQLLDPVVVEAYGTQMHINELANVSVPDPTLITITPWDKSVLGAMEKAIASSPLNIHPVVDGDMIRISIPPLTEERRKEMVKLLSQKIENGRVMLRNVRGDARKEIEKMEGPGVSEDSIKTDLAELDKRVKQCMDQIDKMASEKEKELMKVG